MLSKEVSSTIFWDFGMNPPGIEPWSPVQLANTPIDLLKQADVNFTFLVKNGLLNSYKIELFLVLAFYIEGKST